MNLSTNRLLIRKACLEDASFLLKLLNTPAFLKNIGDRNVRTLDDAKNYIISKYFEVYNTLGYGYYMLVTKDTNTIIGTAGLVNREGLDGIDVGFALLPDFKGKGYGYEATKAIMQYATTTYGIKTYLAITLPSNEPSQRLLEKLGLKFKKMIFIPNDPEELMLYST